MLWQNQNFLLLKDCGFGDIPEDVESIEDFPDEVQIEIGEIRFCIIVHFLVILTLYWSELEFKNPFTNLILENCLNATNITEPIAPNITTNVTDNEFLQYRAMKTLHDLLYYSVQSYYS